MFCIQQLNGLFSDILLSQSEIVTTIRLTLSPSRDLLHYKSVIVTVNYPGLSYEGGWEWYRQIWLANLNPTHIVLSAVNQSCQNSTVLLPLLVCSIRMSHPTDLWIKKLKMWRSNLLPQWQCTEHRGTSEWFTMYSAFSEHHKLE